MCPKCQFIEGHQAECPERLEDPKWLIDYLYTEVMCSKYGTKNRVELLTKLKGIFNLL